MKRILSLITVFMLCLSMAAFADDYDILNTQLNSYEADISVTMSVNEPMTVLNLISASSGIDNFVNLQALAESLADSKSTGTVKLNSNSDYTKMKMSYEIFEITPIRINRNFKLTSEMALGMWFEWDITDELNPVIKYVVQHPMCDKYMSVDVVELMKNQGMSVPDFVSSIKGYLSAERIDELNGKLTDILRKNSSIASKNNKITITVTSEQMESFIAELMDFVIEEFDDNEDFDLLHDGDFGFVSEILPDSEQVKEFFEEVRLFDENALVMEYVKTPGGVLKSASVSLNMNIDLEKALDEMDIHVISDTPKNLKFSVKSDVSYKSVNGNVKVEFPVLAQDDIIDFNDLINSYTYNYDYDWNGENCYHDEYKYIYCDYIPAENNNFYISLPEITSGFEHYGYEYNISRNADSVVLTDEAGKESFGKAEMTVGSDVLYIDGMQYTLSNPVIVSGGKIFIDTDAIKYIFNLDFDYASVDLETNELSCSFERRSPQCHHTEEEMYSYSEDSNYCEHYQCIYVSSDYPYNGVGYIKIRDILNEICQVCGIYYDNGVLTVTDPTGESGFGTVVITVGSNEYIVDGMTITSGKPAVEYYDSIYIDESAAFPIFGFETHNPSLEYIRTYNEDGSIESSYMEYNARLVRKSPYCPHTDEELEDYYRWWE